MFKIEIGSSFQTAAGQCASPAGLVGGGQDNGAPRMKRLRMSRRRSNEEDGQ
jgi:hypothetical protein